MVMHSICRECHWHRPILLYQPERKKELHAWVKFQAWKKAGLPSFVLTGCCAEFHWKPLIKLLQEFLREIGDHSDIENDRRELSSNTAIWFRQI